MRISIVIDDQLMCAVLRATGLRTKRAAVELGLKTLLQIKRQERIRRYRGKLKWEGDFDSLRASRT
jgi:Arc/MetJ family transcription regulator